jgi:hypothetical protein
MSQIDFLNPLFTAVRQVVDEARRPAFRSSNAILLKMYWEIGKLDDANKLSLSWALCPTSPHAHPTFHHRLHPPRDPND